MNILQIANKAIYPPDGGNLAILSFSKAYTSSGHYVHLLNMITHKHVNNGSVLKELNNTLKITGVEVNTKVSFFKVILNFLFSRKPLIAQRFISKKFSQKLISILGNNHFDMLQLEGLYVLQYIHLIKKHYQGKIIYRPHNNEYLIWQRNYKEHQSSLKKIYFKSLSKRLKKLEKRLINTYDYIAPISSQDEKIFNYLGNKKPSLIAPFGIDLEKFKNYNTKNLDSNKKTINYIGALDWIPNQEGILWFINECLPGIVKIFPDVQFNIAGRNAPEWFQKKLTHPNIHFTGEVEDAYEFIKTPGPMIVPLCSGSGMRVKIIECMALKKTIIATSIAAEGINCVHNHNIILANHKNDFINSISSIINSNKKQEEIGENAFKFVQENYNFEKIANKLLNFIK